MVFMINLELERLKIKKGSSLIKSTFENSKQRSKLNAKGLSVIPEADRSLKDALEIVKSANKT